MSVFHIKPAQETYVLVGIYLQDIQEVGIAVRVMRLKPCRVVGDDAGATNCRILDLGRWHLSTSMVVPTLTTTITSASSTMGRIIRLLLLETLKRGWGINLGWRTGNCGGVVIPCSTGCDSGPWDIGVGGEIAICCIGNCCCWRSCSLFEASCWSEALIWLVLSSRDAAVCCERCAMWELMVPAMVSVVSSSNTSLVLPPAVRAAYRFRDAHPPCPAGMVPEARQR